MKKRMLGLLLSLSLALTAVAVPVYAGFDIIAEESYPLLGQTFTPLDLRGVMNMGYADAVAGDGKGGWSDQGPTNDMRNFDLRGVTTLCGIEFDIVDPDENDGNAVITMRGQNDEHFPTSVEIPVGGKTAAGAYFLHSSCFITRTSEVGDYVFVYTDGTEAVIPVRPFNDVFNWWGNGMGERSLTAWTGSNVSTSAISLYAFAAENPNPEKPIEKIRIQTGGGGAYLLVVAATLTDRGPYIMSPKDVGNRDMSSWFPYVMPSITEITGTVLDASFMLDAPAGKHGFVRAEGEKMFFEDGTEARFWGVNLGPENIFVSHDRADRLVDRIAALGFNLVRFHHMDMVSQPEMNIFNGNKNSWTLNAAQMDELCYLMAKLKERGIYWFVDQTVSKRATEDDNHPQRTGLDLAFKKTAWFDEQAIQIQERYTEQLFSWYNPYTGCRIADDPALVFTDMQNESSMFNADDTGLDYYQQELQSLFNDWLEQEYGSDEAIIQAWADGERSGLEAGESLAKRNISPGVKNGRGIYTNQRQNAILKFLSDTMIGFYDRMHVVLDRVGVKCLTTPATMWGINAPSMNYVCGHSDFIDQHQYWSHPSDLRYMREGTKSNFNKPVSMLEVGTSIGFFQQFANQRLWGRPQTISEWEDCEMNPTMGEGGVLMAAYASMQEWHPLYFALGVSDMSDIPANYSSLPRQRMASGDDRYKEDINIIRGWFAVNNSPIKMATIPAAGIMYLRGDVQPITEGFYQRKRECDYFDVDNASFSADASIMAIGRTGVAYDVFGYDAEYNSNDVLYLAEQAKKEQKPFVSLTGETETDIYNHTFRLNTERSQAALGRISGKRMETDDMIAVIDNDFATISLTSWTKDAPIWDADTILLSVAGDARNTGEVRNADGTEIVKAGTSPILIEPITGTITLKSKDDFMVYTIAPTGRRSNTALTTKDADGNTVIHLRADDCVLNYEIVRVNKAAGHGPNAKVVFSNNKIEPLFDDLEGYDWAEKQITRCALLEVMKGVGSETFAPGASATRGDFVASVLKAVNLSAPFDENFADVEKGSANYNALGMGKALGIVAGDADNCIHPNAPVSRQEALCIVGAALQAKGISMQPATGSEISAYSDGNAVSDDAKKAVTEMLAQSYIKSLWPDKLEPEKALTRAEAACILYGMQWN